jgi:hypothetical protein
MVLGCGDPVLCVPTRGQTLHAGGWGNVFCRHTKGKLDPRYAHHCHLLSPSYSSISFCRKRLTFLFNPCDKRDLNSLIREPFPSIGLPQNHNDPTVKTTIVEPSSNPSRHIRKLNMNPTSASPRTQHSKIKNGNHSEQDNPKVLSLRPSLQDNRVNREVGIESASAPQERVRDAPAPSHHLRAEEKVEWEQHSLD